VSTTPARAERSNAAETVAGLIAAVAFAVATLGIVYKPVRVIPIAIVVALVAVGMSGRSSRLAAVAAAWAAVCWIAGMTIAVLTDRALW
jgi:hypothetical protein